MKEKTKEKAKAKAKAVKGKAKALKAKAKGRGARKVAAGLVALGALCMAGCMDTAPASRATTNNEGDVEPAVKVCIGDNSHSNTVIVTQKVTHGDGAIASADSTGSTETQTATPTLDVRTRVDARYNDAISGATTASQKVLGAIADGATGVLELMQSKKSGTVKVTKTDGEEATVECKDGQCSFVE